MKRHLIHRLSMMVILLTLTAYRCEQPIAPLWYLDMQQLSRAYLAAVEDARVALPSEISSTLPAITAPGDNPQIEWINEQGEDWLLVCSIMNGDKAKAWPMLKSLTTNATLLTWVTLPYELEAHMRRLPVCRDSLECRMRMLQLLGLPPKSNYDRLVFFYVSPRRLLRPTPDPEIDDNHASLTFSAAAPAHYRKWFAQNSKYSYNSDRPYPWTRLGYSYNWNAEADSPVGPGEFIVHPKTVVRVERQVNIWEWYGQQVLPLRSTACD